MVRLRFLLPVLAAIPVHAGAGPVTIGSKRFTESYVLAEIAKTALLRAGFPAEHRPGMGGTVILWQALKSRSIDVYPEYTGTIAEEILQRPDRPSVAVLRSALAANGISMTDPLGFNNTYALVMRRVRARALGIESISDLRRHPELVVGVTHEFLKRRDGWEPLFARYGLRMRDVRGVDHAIGYQALASGAIDVKDAYSTDARISQDDLVALRDDLNFFPRYDAVFLFRSDIDSGAASTLASLSGTLDEAKMTRLNAEAERVKDYGAAASLYFGTRPARRPGVAGQIARWTGRHLELVSISLATAVLAGLPLGILAFRFPRAGAFILGAAGIVQTIPALALLALLVPVPFLGIRPATAVVALFLYSLLPIIRNTTTGLQEISPALRESAEAMGLSRATQLRKILLPMASRSILAGIRTSAVINVGTATLAALIGAGGLGEPIVSGLNLNDHATILEGAVPAALLALGVELLFLGLDRVIIPRGLRLPAPDA
ncbi:MAG: glycine betaine ABC transporter substrate-binding protein [Thermoanaerobaculia bacterium]